MEHLQKVRELMINFYKGLRQNDNILQNGNDWVEINPKSVIG